MATITYKRYDAGIGASTYSYFGQMLGYLFSNTSMSDTRMSGSPGAGERAALTGTGLEYTTSGGPPRPVDGTISKLSLVHLNEQILLVTGISLNGATFGLEVLGGVNGLVEYVHKGNDKITGTTENDALYAFNGNDTVSGGGLQDTLYGGFGNDRLLGQADNDLLFGDGGNDTLIGESGNDLMYGSDGRDSLSGGSLNDTMYGDDDKDILNGGDGNDLLYGGDGGDRLLGAGGENLLYGGDGEDTMSGGVADDTLDGGNGNDRVDGGTGGDTLYGGNGDDRLTGGAGADYLVGDDDNDVLRGGTGSDSLVGGSESDRFVFETALGAGNVDLVDDFEEDIDLIVLDNDIFTAAGPVGALSAARFRIGANAADPSDRIIYDSATGALYYDRDGTGGAAKVQFATLSSGLTLDAADFLITG